MSKSCLKVRCPVCKGRTRLSAEAFAQLRRQPSMSVDHACEHCGTRFPATLAMHSPSDPQIILPAAVQAPASAAPAMPQAVAPPPPMAVPFAPRTEAAAGAAVPFGMLGDRRDEAAAKPRADAPLNAPPPLAAGATAGSPSEGKQSVNEWWKSQPPKKQWTMIACVAVTFGAVLFAMDSGEASASATQSDVAEKETVVKEPEKTPNVKDIAATKPV